MLIAATLVVGSESLDQLAEIIWRSVGPSGRNKVTFLRGGVLRVLTRQTQDYLYELAKAVHKLSPESHDSHLYALEVCR